MAEIKRTISVLPPAALAMALHCQRHGTEAVHGILLGTIDAKDIIVVTDAVPVTHGAPTAPIIEGAFGLLPHCIKGEQKVSVLGWYTAAMLLQDTRPGPLALRIISNLGGAASSETESPLMPVVKDPVLIVLQNDLLASLFHAGASAEASFLKAFGRDSRNQWLSPIASVEMQQIENVSTAILKAKEESVVISDLLDFYEECSAPKSSSSSPATWFPNGKVAALLHK